MSADQADSPVSLGAEDGTTADQLAEDFFNCTLIAARRNLGKTWASIGAPEGKPPKIAKRDAKRLRKATRRAWYLHHNQEN